jgi:hypothetical protein
VYVFKLHFEAKNHWMDHHEKTRCIFFPRSRIVTTATAAEIESRFAKFGDVKIHYDNRGKGDEALVFVHGWNCNADFWRTQMRRFWIFALDSRRPGGPWKE